MRVYVAGPMQAYKCAHFDRAVAIASELHPGAEILDARGMFATTAVWLREWPAIAGTIDVVLFVADLDGYIGRGVLREVQDVANLGGQVLFVDGETITPLFTVGPTNDNDWRRHAQVQGHPPAPTTIQPAAQADPETPMPETNDEMDDRLTAARLADPDRPRCEPCNAPRNVAPWGEHWCGKTEMLGKPVPDFEQGTWHTGSDTDRTLTVRVADDGDLQVQQQPSDVKILDHARALFPLLRWVVDVREGGGLSFEGTARKIADGAIGIVMIREDGVWQAEACPQIATAFDVDPFVALQTLRAMLTDMQTDADSLLDGSADPAGEWMDDDAPAADDVEANAIKLLHLMVGSGPGGWLPRECHRWHDVPDLLADLEARGLVHKGADNWSITGAGKNEVAKALEDGNLATIHYMDADGGGMCAVHLHGDEAEAVHHVLGLMLGQPTTTPRPNTFDLRSHPPKVRDEIRDCEDSSSACARACGEDEDAAAALPGWVARGDGTHTKRGWTVEPHYMGADGEPSAWVARRPEGGTLPGGHPSAASCRKAVDEVLDRLDRLEIEASSGSPLDPVLDDTPLAVLVSRMLLAWPGCETSATPAALARSAPGRADMLKVRHGKHWIDIQYCCANDVIHGPLHWRYVTSRDEGRYSDQLTTVASVVAEVLGTAL